MISLQKTLLLLTLSSLSLSPAFANTSAHLVHKADGSVGKYLFLPVHYDASHAREVLNRRADLASVALPASYQIPAALIPAVRDQGERGTCAYFSTIAITEAYYMAQSRNNSGINLSEECLADVRDWMYDQGTKYTGDDKPDQRPDPNGDFPASIVKTIEENGVPLANKFGSTDCRYSATDGRKVSLSAYLASFKGANASRPYAKGLTYAQNTAPTIEAVKALLANNNPVEVGIIVYNEYMNESDWRFNAAVDVDSNIAGGHAITLTGYKTSGTKTIFTFKNSWGTSWGSAGYGTIDDGILSHSWAYDPGYDFIVSLHN